jgi:hypothetical protein
VGDAGRQQEDAGGTGRSMASAVECEVDRAGHFDIEIDCIATT